MNATTVASMDEHQPVELSNVADGLAAVVALRRLADQLEDQQVEQAMREGWTWLAVAEALRVTHQAVYKKHAKRLADAGVALRRRSNG